MHIFLIIVGSILLGTCRFMSSKLTQEQSVENGEFSTNLAIRFRIFREL